jgi:SAM-dependent methyltransferase
MPLHWIDAENLSFNTMLLLERVQLSWLPGWVPDAPLAIALKANPVVEWYMRNKCPEIQKWLDHVMSLPEASKRFRKEKIRRAEEFILYMINDLVVYAVDPDIYDGMEFLKYPDSVLTGLVDFSGKKVVDVGSGTGRLAFVAAEKGAAWVYAVEPVGNLRRFLKEKAQRLGYQNFSAVDGLITSIPFEDGFADVVLAGHVFGDNFEGELAELKRVTRPGGMVILCPGSSRSEDPTHQFLVERGIQWEEFIEPPDGVVRKYWFVV